MIQKAQLLILFVPIVLSACHGVVYSDQYFCYPGETLELMPEIIDKNTWEYLGFIRYSTTASGSMCDRSEKTVQIAKIIRRCM